MGEIRAKRAVEREITMKDIVFSRSLALAILPVALFGFASCAGASNGPDLEREVEEPSLSEDMVSVEEEPAVEPAVDVPVEPDLPLEPDMTPDTAEEGGPSCATISALRSAGDGPVDMQMCPAFVTYVTYLGYFLQTNKDGPAIMVFEGTEWVPDVIVGDQVEMRVSSLTTYRGTKEINGHGPVTIITRGTDIGDLVQDIASGIMPGEELESEIIRVENAMVEEIDGRDVTISYGTASGVWLLPEDSGLLCPGSTFTLQGVVLERSDLSTYHIRSFENGDLSGIDVSSCLRGGRFPQAGELLINEFLFDPPDGLEGDANCDGRRDANEDEFIEIVNIGSDLLSLSEVTISDAVGVRHSFWPGTVLPPGKAIVVFGGGIPSCSYTSDVEVVKSSRGGLYLDLAGDSITVTHATSLIISSTSYPPSVVFDQSLTLFPDLDDEDPSPDGNGGYIGHWGADSVDHSLFSPGTRIDGSPF